MTKTNFERLEALREAVRALSAEAWAIIGENESAPTPYWNIIAALAEAEKACRGALRVEELKEGRHAA